MVKRFWPSLVLNQYHLFKFVGVHICTYLHHTFCLVLIQMKETWPTLLLTTSIKSSFSEIVKRAWNISELYFSGCLFLSLKVGRIYPDLHICSNKTFLEDFPSLVLYSWAPSIILDDFALPHLFLILDWPLNPCEFLILELSLTSCVFLILDLSLCLRVPDPGLVFYFLRVPDPGFVPHSSRVPSPAISFHYSHPSPANNSLRSSFQIWEATFGEKRPFSDHFTTFK